MSEQFPTAPTPETPKQPKALEEMLLPEVEDNIEKLSQELTDLLQRRAVATDKMARKALESEVSRKLQERAGYQMRRMEILRGIPKAASEGE